MPQDAPAPAEATNSPGSAGQYTSTPLRPVSDSPGAFVGTSMAATSHTRFLNALFYGRHGGGKSTLAASAADVDEMRDVLVVTAEGGDVVYEGNPRIRNWELIDVIKVDRIEQFQKVYEWVKAHVNFRDRPDKEEQLRKLQDVAFPHVPDPQRLRRYRTVIVDSLTEIESMNLAKILGMDDVGFDAGDEMEVAGYPQFRKNMHMIQKIVRQFRDLDINFLTICAETWVQDERKAYHYSPRLTGQLKDIIQGFFDVVGWIVPNQTEVDPVTGNPKRRLFVQPQTQPRADAKCRLATYKGAYFDDPYMRDIMSQTGFIRG
jgi:hypothetical protein